MVYELKKIVVSEQLSEETMCFSAQIWVGGKIVCNVSNRGVGGCNEFHPYNKEIASKFDNIEMECEIMTRVEKYNFATKNQSKGFALSKDDNFYTSKFPMSITKLKKAKDYLEWLEGKKNKFTKEGYELLNRNL